VVHGGRVVCGVQVRREKERYEEAVRLLDRTKSRAIKEGLRSIEQFVEEHKIEGVHGPLIDLIHVSNENCVVAVEV